MKLCCIKLSLAARVIAMVGLVMSVLVLTQLFTELVNFDGKPGTVSILLGLDIDDITEQNYGFELKICFLVFAFVYAVSSSILIWGSIVEVSTYAIPWLVCEALSFIAKVITVVLISSKLAQNKQFDNWTFLLAINNVFLSIYFWAVVFCAQRAWRILRRQERETMSTSTLSSGNETILQEDIFEPPPITAPTGKIVHV